MAFLSLRLSTHKGLKRKALIFISAYVLEKRLLAEKQIPEEAYTETDWHMRGVKTKAQRGIFTAR